MSTGSLASLSNRIRVSGMASGMDTESIVNSLMLIEKMKIDKLYRSKVLVEWKNDALRNINNSIRDFRNKYMSVLSPETNLYTESAYKVFRAEVDQNNAVTISANSRAKVGNYQIVSIDNLAKSAMVLSEDNIATGEIKTSELLKNSPLNKPLFEEGETEITFSINGAEITINDTDTLETMMSKINNSDAGVTFSYSSLSGKFSLITKETGSAAELEIIDESGKFFGEDSAFGFSSIISGEDARLTINDGTGSYEIERSSNTFTIDGITYNLKATTNTPVNFSIAQDLDTPVNKIKDFINAYNTLVKDLYQKNTENKKYNYSPLTEEQKKEMKEDEIKMWEEQAKKGLLKNDFKISNLLSKMRAMVYEKVEDAGLSLADIGITTIEYTYGGEYGGQLKIDEDKLKKALSERPDDVAKLFTNTSSSIDSAEKYRQSGLIPKLTTVFSDYTGSVDFSKFADDIRNYESLIRTQEYKMYQQQEAYYRKFAALEAALADMYSQSSWLSQQLSVF